MKCVKLSQCLPINIMLNEKSIEVINQREEVGEMWK